MLAVSMLLLIIVSPAFSKIPESISEFMEISDKDELEWKMHVENNTRLAIIQKKAAADSV
jgi:hypothetical protein